MAEETKVRKRATEEEIAAQVDRREFVKKYGALAAVTPVALAALMHSDRANAQSDSANF